MTAKSDAGVKLSKRTKAVEQRRKARAYAMQRNIQQLEKMIRSRVPHKSK